ncbi:alpha-amylase family glycosyl hydrolase [Halorubrum sp. HHNYT27]|uniref:alpha-amylase family glycosyl hydrolase n=1 Tax=Halorubrum sp. HHNYT27 TaxID=3402275 RepID=UPI003EB6ACC6
MTDETSSRFPPVRDSGILRIPALDVEGVEIRFAPLLSRADFDPSSWERKPLSAVPDSPGWYQIDLDELGLADGQYEYEYALDRGGDDPDIAPDPFAEEITRFQGYRGTFRIRDGEQFRPPFSWDDEIPDDGLPANEELVIYEFPPRWAAPVSHDYRRNVADGDFQDLLTDHLDNLVDLGVNAIELLPIQDAPQSLGWGYGTRFFFAPDSDLGGPVDAKFLIKACHRRGIRVFLDVVVNHATGCPLETLADEWFFLHPDEQPDRPTWGGRRFDFESVVDDVHPAREFLCRMAEYWVEEYHVDGFRLDEFKGADHWRFFQQFRDRTWAVQDELFPERPFLVIAEDSHARPQIVHDNDENPEGRTVVDSMWNFAFQEESRRLLRGDIEPGPDQPPRSDRLEALITGDRTWDDLTGEFDDGFADLTKTVNYMTSHDVGSEGDQRLMNFVFGEMVRERGLGDGSIENVKYLIDDLVTAESDVQLHTHTEAVDRLRSAFALLLTSAGIPMFLAGEEFGDIHDLDYTDWQLKMEDPVDWTRRDYPGHAGLRDSVRDLIHLRTSTEALQRNEVETFYVDPTMDENDGSRVFAYCRTKGDTLGSEEQVVVVANVGPQAYDSYDVPWYWPDAERVTERGAPLGETAFEISPDEEGATLSLSPFQVRIFTT